MMKPKILGLSGSLRPNSSSHVVLNEVAQLLCAKAEFELFEGIGTLPHFDGREEDAPQAVLDFRKKIRETNGVLICTPEYAFGVPGSLKNALDWTVGTGDFVDKPVALITASSQGEKGHEALQWILQAISAKTELENTLLIQFIRSKVKEGKIADANTQTKVQALAAHFLNSLQNNGN